MAVAAKNSINNIRALKNNTFSSHVWLCRSVFFHPWCAEVQLAAAELRAPRAGAVYQERSNCLCRVCDLEEVCQPRLGGQELLSSPHRLSHRELAVQKNHPGRITQWGHGTGCAGTVFLAVLRLQGENVWSLAFKEGIAIIYNCKIFTIHRNLWKVMMAGHRR